MTALNKDALKALFQTGDTITQTTMANLIDSFVDTVETSAQNIAGPINFNGLVTFNNTIAVSAITSGQLLIGTTGNGVIKNTITAGANVSVTNGPGTITIAVPGAAGGNLVLVQSQTASTSASIIFTSSNITATYRMYMVVIESCVPATGTAVLNVFFSENNGSDYISAGVYGSVQTDDSNGSGYASTSFAGGGNAILHASVSPGNYGGVFFIVNPSNAAYKHIFSQGSSAESTNHGHKADMSAMIFDTNVINNIKFQMDSGNITSGQFSLYGVL